MLVDLTPSKGEPDEALAAVATRRSEGKSVVIAPCIEPREDPEARTRVIQLQA